MSRSGADRGQSELIGVVLLFGLVVVTATSVFVIGGIAINDVSQEVDLERGLTEMRQADSRMSRVAFGQQGGQVVVFGESDSPAEVQKGSSLTITLHGNDTTCRENIPMGSIVKHVDGGGTIAYEGGGVWRESEGGGVTMVSPPDLQYKNGSINFPMVSLSNATTGQVDSLEITKDANASRVRNKAITKEFEKCKPPNKPPKNMTITVQSDYYEAWGAYMEERVASNVTYDDGDRTASTTLDRIGETWAASESSVRMERNFTARVEVLGTELSGLGYDSGFIFPGRGYYIQHTPISMSVIVNGEKRHPEGWPDNLNDPDNPDTYTYTLTGDPGTTVSVEATSYHGEDYEWAENTSEITGYDQKRPTDFGSEWVSIEASGQGSKNISNLQVKQDGDRIKGYGQAANYQKTIGQMLPDGLTGKNSDGEPIFDLNENQMVFVYELSEPNANPENAGQSGDPDYNDAVVLFELEQAEQAESNFFVHVSVSQVQVEEAG